MEVVLKRLFLAKQGHLHSATQTRGGYTFLVENVLFHLWATGAIWEEPHGMVKVVAKNVRSIR